MNFLTSFNLVEIGTATMILFAVIDIVGSIPILIKIKGDVGFIEARKATLVAGAIMIVFLFLGTSILQLVGINVESFAVAGSLVLFGLALEMIFGIEVFKSSDDEIGNKSASIVPIAFPLIAGAGSMTTIVSLRAEFQSINIVIAIILNMIIVYLVLRSTSIIERILGNTGIVVLKKVFGIILMAIAVKLFSTNVKLLF
ncbi:MAG: MarC family protein [Crocinitomicaceae bacterium]